MQIPTTPSFSLRGKVLIIIPPFAGIDRPALGPHLLQACAREAGFEVSLLYVNLLLAADIGETSYMAICSVAGPITWDCRSACSGAA